MRELSLFTGAGGGLLGTHLLGWTPIGYVEYDDYCQRVIRARIDDGILPNAPIFGDIRTFISDGYAASYHGMVDVVTGGFPCQPFSNAGKKLGADDPRNMWPSAIECIRLVRPRYALLENVPGLLTSGYFGTILGDLAEAGYDARWKTLSAEDLGFDHKRERLWIVAYAIRQGREGILCRGLRLCLQDNSYGKKKAPNTLDAVFGTLSQAEQRLGEPSICGTDDGMAHRVDRLKAIGNGQVPAVVRAAWEILTNES